MPRRRVPVRTGMRRKTAWSVGPGDLATTAIVSTSTSIIIGSGASAALAGLTIVRIRGIINLILMSATATLDGFGYAFGIAIVTGDAFTAGAVPDPLGELASNGAESRANGEDALKTPKLYHNQPS